MKQTYSVLPPITLPSEPAQPKLERLYTTPQLCEFFHVGERAIYRWIASGKLVTSKIGRNHMVTESNLAAFIQGAEGESFRHQKAKATTEAK